jgi:hypothetical protein
VLEGVHAEMGREMTRASTGSALRHRPLGPAMVIAVAGCAALWVLVLAGAAWALHCRMAARAGMTERAANAAATGDTGELRRLLDNGVSPGDAIDGDTLLTLAALGGHVEAVQLLLDRGADCNALASGGGSAIHSALIAPQPSPGVIRALLAAGADPNVQDDAGRTALHWAAWRGSNADADEVTALLEAGADRSLRDSMGRTPSEAAREHGHDGIARLIDDWPKASAGSAESGVR